MNNKIDTITLSLKEYRDLADRIQSNVAFQTLICNKEIAINNFRLHLGEDIFIYEFKDPELVISRIDKNEKLLWQDSWDNTREKGKYLKPIIISEGIKKLFENKDYDAAKDYGRVHGQIALIFFFIQWYMKNLPEIWSNQTKTNYIRNSDKSDKKHKYIAKLINHYKLNPIEYNKLKESPYTCPCWGVRGHWRHLKDGRTIWIKAFKKGKLRNNEEYVGKEYNL